MNCVLKSCLVEFIGAFFLVFTVGSAILMNANPAVIPIAIGFILMVMVYAGGHISGGHYNPAVSLAATLRGSLPWKYIIHYVLAQLAGAAAAAYVVIYLAGTYAGDVVEFPVIPLIIGEFLFTFALCYVVLLSATSERVKGNSYFGLAIGSTVTVGAFTVAAVCFAAFNPAVALGLGILGIAGWKLIGITVLANIAGAIAAGIAYKMVNID